MRASTAVCSRVLALTASVLLACAAAPAGHPRAASRPVPRDVHGEPLALLPPSGTVYLRVDAAALRASPHWAVALELLQGSAPALLRTLERELGFDLVGTAHSFALGMYAPPGARPDDVTQAWPLLYIRGPLDRAAIEAAARARARPGDPLVERTVDQMQFLATHSRAYWFAAPDVLFLFDPSLIGRLARQMSGEERESAASDDRFDALWGEAGGRGGSIQLAADVAALQRLVPPSETGLPTASAALTTAVARLDASGDVQIRCAARATSEAAAIAVVRSVDDARAAALRRFEVRMMGLTRLLEQGLTAVNEGTHVRIAVDAREGEVTRILRAARLLQ